MPAASMVSASGDTALESKDVAIRSETRIACVGSAEVRSGSPDEMRTMIASEISRWKQVTADAGIPKQ
jgi:hypothetical protein